MYYMLHFIKPSIKNFASLLNYSKIACPQSNHVFTNDLM